MGFVTKLLINSPANKREMGTPDSRNLISVISWLFQTRKYADTKIGKLHDVNPRAARLHPEQKGRERETKGGQNGYG